MGTSKNKPSFEFCAEECGVLKILHIGMHLRIEQPVWQIWRISLVLSTSVVCLKRGEENRRENE